ncbi:unnamed protein product, partial [Strongylus vulgaris]
MEEDLFEKELTLPTKREEEITEILVEEELLKTMDQTGKKPVKKQVRVPKRGTEDVEEVTKQTMEEEEGKKELEIEVDKKKIVEEEIVHRKELKEEEPATEKPVEPRKKEYEEGKISPKEGQKVKKDSATEVTKFSEEVAVVTKDEKSEKEKKEGTRLKKVKAKKGLPAKEEATEEVISVEEEVIEKFPEEESGKKKKKVPKALVIPDEISSRFGEPSTLLSETNITTKIVAREGSAEAISPVKQPQSASVAVKVDSKIRPRAGTPSEEFSEFPFKRRSQTPEGKEEDVGSRPGLKPKSTDRAGLPPKPGAEKPEMMEEAEKERFAEKQTKAEEDNLIEKKKEIKGKEMLEEKAKEKKPEEVAIGKKKKEMKEKKKPEEKEKELGKKEEIREKEKKEEKVEEKEKEEALPKKKKEIKEKDKSEVEPREKKPKEESVFAKKQVKEKEKPEEKQKELEKKQEEKEKERKEVKVEEKEQKEEAVLGKRETKEKDKLGAKSEEKKPKEEAVLAEKIKEKEKLDEKQKELEKKKEVKEKERKEEKVEGKKPKEEAVPEKMKETKEKEKPEEELKEKKPKEEAILAKKQVKEKEKPEEKQKELEKKQEGKEKEKKGEKFEEKKEETLPEKKKEMKEKEKPEEEPKEKKPKEEAVLAKKQLKEKEKPKEKQKELEKKQEAREKERKEEEVKEKKPKEVVSEMKETKETEEKKLKEEAMPGMKERKSKEKEKKEEEIEEKRPKKTELGEKKKEMIGEDKLNKKTEEESALETKIEVMEEKSEKKEEEKKPEAGLLSERKTEEDKDIKKKKKLKKKVEVVIEEKKDQTGEEIKVLLNGEVKETSEVIEPEKRPEKKRKQLIEETIPEDEAVDVLSGEVDKRDSEAVSSRTSRKSSGASSVESYTISRRRMRKEGFVSTPGAEVLALRGDTVRLECELVNDHDEVEWFINDKSFAADARASEESLGPMRILLIRDLTPRDTDMIVEVRLGDYSAISKITVEDTHPEMIKRLQRRTTGREGQDVVLSVEVDHEAQEVAWFKNDIMLTTSEKYLVEAEGTVYRLTIREATYGDAGQYNVVVDGSKSYTNLQIQGKPVVKKVERRIIEVERDENIIFNVPFECYEEPTVSCLFNGTALREDAKIHIDMSDDIVRFCKKHVKKADSGEYTIKLFNEIGEDSETVTVRVKDVPGKPQSVSVTEIESEAISIAWTAPENDGGQPITGYIVEKKEDGRRTFHKVAQVSASKTSYTVEDLEMVTGYILRVSAVNKYGAGEPTDTPVVTTGTPYTAPQITEPPIISQVSGNTCALSWEKPAHDGESPIYGYDVYRKENGGNWIKARSLIFTSSRLIRINDELQFHEHFTVKNLQPNISYVFKVEAHNEAGFISSSNVESEPLLIRATLDVPTTILPTPRVITTGLESVTVEWDVDEYVAYSEFVLSYKSESSSVWTEVTCKTNSCKINELKEGVSYVFKVAPINEQGIGEYSEETQPIKIMPAVAPVIIKPIKNVTVPRKRTLHLECHANGEPAPEYVWFKDGVEIIPENSNTEIVNEGYMSFLKIHSVEAFDAGNYMCEVENEHGKTSCSAKIQISDVRCHFESSFSEYIEATEGQDIQLRCTLSDKDGVVVWYKDGKVLKDDDHISISAEDTSRTLKITGANDSDSGMYRCETSDGRSKTEGELLVKEEEPHIRVGPQDDTIREFGKTVELKCELTKPVHRVLWFRNKKEIWAQMNKYLIETIDCTSTLVILNFDRSDVGDYYAVLSEKESSAPAHIELEVAPEIKITENLGEQITLHADAELDFHVEAYGNPQPLITILHKNERIQSRPEVNVEEYEDVLSVRMKNLTQNDIGTIRITAENVAGTAQKELSLNVIDVPSEPLDLEAREITAESTILSWSPPEEENGADVTSYVIERRAVESNRWRTVGKTDANTFVFKAEGLMSKQVYGFRVMAVNEVGEGPPSQLIDIITLEEEAVDGVLPELVLLDAPGAPSVERDEGKITVAWNPVMDAMVYRLERRDESNDWLEVVTIDKTTFVDRSLQKSGTYRYRVIAENPNAESKPSGESAPVSVVIERKEGEEDASLGRREDVVEAEMADTAEKIVDGLQINGAKTDG